MAQAKRKTAEAPEQRSHERELTIKHAVVTVDTECAVFDVSPKGAKLLLHGNIRFPETFKIKIDSGATKICRVAWRKGNQYGVEFISPDNMKKMARDARRSKREQIFDRATIVYNDGFCSMDCRVVDYSAEGARLRPLNIRDCPVNFQLQIKYGPTHNCFVLRRTGQDVAVRFIAM